MNKHNPSGKRRRGRPPANHRTNVFVEKAKALQAADLPTTRLLSKPEVMAIANVSFVTLWAWMRTGKFPRSRIVGGKSMWLSTDVERWLAGLPLRPLKGDQPVEASNARRPA
jgi:predicted DNA-binding transcriptional regulator AlpA